MILNLFIVLLVLTTGSHQAQRDPCSCWYKTNASVVLLRDSKKLSVSIKTISTCLDFLKKDKFEIKIRDLTSSRNPTYEVVQCMKISCVNLILNTSYELQRNYSIEIAPACCWDCTGYRFYVDTFIDNINKPTLNLRSRIPVTPPINEGQLTPVQNKHSPNVELILVIIIPVTTIAFVLTLLGFIWVNREVIKHRLERRASATSLCHPNNRRVHETIPLVQITTEMLPAMKQHYVIASYPVSHLGDKQVNNIVSNVTEIIKSQRVSGVYSLKVNDMNLQDTLFSNLQDCSHVVVMVTDKLADMWRMKDDINNIEIYFKEIKYMFNFLKGIRGLEKRIYAINLINSPHHESVFQEIVNQFQTKMACDFRTEHSRTCSLQMLLNDCLFVRSYPDVCLTEDPSVNKHAIDQWSKTYFNPRTDNQNNAHSNQHNRIK